MERQRAPLIACQSRTREAEDVDRSLLLANIPMFEGLGEQDRHDLAAELTEIHLSAGQLIFEAGSNGDAMYIVARGEVNIHLPGNDTSRVSLATLPMGAVFGEMALFDDQPRSAAAQATCDAVVLELPRGVLQSYVERRPKAALSMLRTMSERLRLTNTMLSERAARNAVEEYEKELRWTDRIADRIAALNGSWLFILSLSGMMIGWAVLNMRGLVFRAAPDPYPYIFFNLVLAVLVGVQWPLIVMSQNRQAKKDKKQAETDFKVNLKNELNCEAILSELREFRAHGIATESDESPPQQQL